MEINDNQITVTLYECQHCGEIAQDQESMVHLGCREDHEYGMFLGASIIKAEFIVQPVEKYNISPG